MLFDTFFLSECECNEDGSVNELCDEASGKCTCKENVIGDKCTQCATEFWGIISNCEGKHLFDKEWSSFLMFLCTKVEFTSFLSGQFY